MEEQVEKRKGKKRKSRNKRKPKAKKVKGKTGNKAIQEVSQDILGLDSIVPFEKDFTNNEKRERYCVI